MQVTPGPDDLQWRRTGGEKPAREVGAGRLASAPVIPLKALARPAATRPYHPLLPSYLADLGWSAHRRQRRDRFRCVGGPGKINESLEFADLTVGTARIM